MRTISLLLLSFLIVTSTAFAQQAPAPELPSGSQPPEEGESAPIRVFVEEVRVPFVVTDNKNHIVTDLAKEDFQVIENKTSQPITAFASETDVPLRIGLLVDTSNSIRNRLSFEQKAASDFLRALIRPGRD